MPKIVDHDQRRREIADAVLTVVRRGGIAAASVRTVAAEAGMSTGSLRHYFDTHEQMMLFAVEMLADDVMARIGVMSERAEGVDGLVDLMLEVVPVDDLRRAEYALWLELATLGTRDDELRAASRRSHEGLRRLCTSVLRVACERDPEVDGGPDETLAAVELHALLDGVSMHLALYPENVDVDDVAALLRARLTGMAAALTGSGRRG